MTGRGDLVLAFATATAVHAGVLVFGLPEGGGGGGDRGQNRVSVTAIAPEVAAMVREWDRSPKVGEVAERADPQIPEDRARKIPPERAVMRVPKPSELSEMTQPIAAPVVNKTIPSPSASVQASDLAPINLAAESAPQRPVRPTRPQAVALMPTPALDRAPPTPDFAPEDSNRPTPRPEKTPAPAVSRQVAAGAGDGGTRGSVPQATGSKPSSAARKAAASAWAAAIERSIARHRAYPRGARDEGRVRVAMVILANGRLADVSVARSSGSAALDKAAVAAVRRAAPFPAAPEVLTDEWYNVGQWIAFERR